MKKIDIDALKKRGLEWFQKFIEHKKSSYHEEMSESQRKTNLKSWGFILPSLLGVLVFFVIPFLVVIYYAMIDNPIRKDFVFLRNIINVFKNSAFRQSAWNTLKFSFTAVPLAVILSLLLAILLDREIPFRSQFRSFFLTPMMVPVASIVLIFQVMFDFNGAVNDVIMKFGVDKIDWFVSDHAMQVIAVLFLWKNLGYNMIIFMAALASMPRDIIEVAKLESASNFQIFYMIKLRYLSPTIMFVTLLSLINSFKIFREVYMLTGEHPYPTLYMLQHYMNNMFVNLDYQKLSAAAIIMCIVMVIIIGILFKIENYFGKDVEG